MFTPLQLPVFSLDSGSLPASGPLSLPRRSSCQSGLSLKGPPCSERTSAQLSRLWSTQHLSDLFLWWCGLPALLDISSVRSEAAGWLFFFFNLLYYPHLEQCLEWSRLGETFLKSMNEWMTKYLNGKAGGMITNGYKDFIFSYNVFSWPFPLALSGTAKWNMTK